ncbi:MAG: cysteine desulfurase family protein [Pseudanabaenaceae cyanobacterium]
MQIYLDYSATTPPRPEVLAKVQEVMTRFWGNPSSIHAWGERAALMVEQAREQVAQLLHADPSEVVFTSGGTEANNMAIFGIARQYHTPQHLIISAIEHSAIAQPVSYLEKLGWQVDRLPVDRQGLVDPQVLKSAIRPNTVLVSIIYAHNEIGTIQPIDKLGAICREAGVLFHTDAVQAVGKITIDLQTQPIDLLSISGHKFYGPQGIGALYINRQVKSLVPLLMGGGQEYNRRSGTPPVALIAGLGTAAELARQELPSETIRLAELRDRLYALTADIPHLIPTGADPPQRLPHHLSFMHERLNGRQIVYGMNLAGIAISASSACSSGKNLPNKNLLAMGYSPQQSQGSIRITCGRETTMADIEWTAMALKQVIQRLSP